MPATRRRFLQTSAAAIAAGTACSPQTGKRPNILFVFSDQQHARTVSAYGGTPVRTPAADRIAAEGCRFDQAISTYAVCSPYRGMLMTGLYPMHNGVVANDTPLPDDLPTLGKLFREAGYRTGYIGKWHLETTRKGFVRPERRQGFDDFWAVHSCNHKHFDSPYYRDDPERELTHAGYEPDSQTDLALGFIRESAARDQPFCLALSFGPPHDPYRAPEHNEARFQPETEIPLPPNVAERTIVDDLLHTDQRPMTARERSARARQRARLDDDARIQTEILRGYYGACEAIDSCLGRLLDGLDEAGIADDTIVVYTSDHGDMVGSHRMVSKQLPFEEATRVPFLVRYPRSIPAGSETSTFITPIDILPTLLGLAGVPYDDAQFDGLDLSATATSGQAETRGAVPLMKMVHGGNPWISNAVRPWRGVRTERHTYAELEGVPWLLFDNQEDPFQMTNLIADSERASLRAQLQREVRRWMDEAGDTLTEAEIDRFRDQQRERFPG